MSENDTTEEHDTSFLSEETEVIVGAFVIGGIFGFLLGAIVPLAGIGLWRSLFR